MSVFRGFLPSKNASETRLGRTMFSDPPGSDSTTSPQPFRCSHVRFVTDVDGVFTKRLVSSKKWCWFLMWDADQGPAPNWWDMFLMEFGVEVLSILTTSHLALGLSCFVDLEALLFLLLFVKLSLWQCHAMPNGWHSITQDWKATI